MLQCRAVCRCVSIFFVAFFFAPTSAFALTTPALISEFVGPPNPYWTAPINFFNVGAIAFFASENVNGGFDLWRTDSTASGTFRVKEINPNTGSKPAYLGTLGNVLYFVADDGQHGRELWRSDGTETGTFLVKDINTGGDDAFPGSDFFEDRAATLLSGKLYFRAYDAVHGVELWCTDGSEVGTQLVKDINPRGNAFPAVTVVDDVPRLPSEVYLVSPNVVRTRELPIVVNDNALYFAADDGEHGVELWRSDGSADGTQLFADIRQDTSRVGSVPLNLTPFGHALIFSADDGEHGRELWVANDTGVSMVIDAMPGKASSIRIERGSPTFGAVLDGAFIYAAAEPADTPINRRQRLWRTDGTAAGTHVIGPEWLPAAGKLDADRFKRVGNWVYLVGSRGPTGPSSYENALWRSDGTDTGTSQITGISGAPDVVDIQNFYATDSALYFTAKKTSADSVSTLWRATFQTQADLVPLIEDAGLGSDVLRFVSGGGNIVYVSALISNSLWRTDGTVGSSVLIPRSACDPHTNSDFAVLADKLLFTDCSENSNRQLRVQFGEQVVLVKDLLPRSEQNYGLVRILGVSTQYVWVLGLDETKHSALWAVDRASGLVQRLVTGPANANPYVNVPFSEAVLVNGVLYFTFSAADGFGNELWRSDGTVAGTSAVARQVASNPRHLAVLKNVLYFFADVPANAIAAPNVPPASGSISIGSGAGTASDIALRTNALTPATLIVDPPLAPIADFVQLPAPSSRVGVTPTLTINGPPPVGLWRSDGTFEGTTLVATVSTGLGVGTFIDSAFNDLVSDGSRLYFSANDANFGSELWVSDGSSAGTHIVVDAVPGKAGSAPSDFTLFNGKVYYSTQDNGVRSLWVSDGSEAGTRRIKEFPPLSGSEECATICWPPWINLNAGSNGLYIVIGDSALGLVDDVTDPWQLWTSDGTPTGTTLLMQTPFAMDSPIVHVDELSLVGDSLYVFGVARGSQNIVFAQVDVGHGTFLPLKFFAPYDRSLVRFMLTRGPSAAFGNLSYFMANDGSHGVELWGSNGTGTGTNLLMDLAPGAASTDFFRASSAPELFADGDDVYFLATPAQSGTKLWRASLKSIAAGVAPIVDSPPAETPAPSQDAGGGGGAAGDLGLVALLLLSLMRVTRNCSLIGSIRFR